MAALMASAVMMAQTPTVSASKVTMKYCKATYGTVNVYASKASLPITKDGFQFDAFGTYVRKLENARGCDSVVTYIVGPNTEGVLPGTFTVNSNGKKVHFSKGNLMYLANNATKTYPEEGSLTHQTRTGTAQGQWKFGETQYAACGNIIENYDPSQTQKKWMDLFGHATSGCSASYVPYRRTSNSPMANISGSDYDWGVFNAIEGGGNYPNVWRSLTQDEWDYILDHHQYGWGVVNSTNGFIILPDNFQMPSGCSFSHNNTGNNYTVAKWADMEAAGAVFMVVDYYSQSASPSSLSGNGGETIYRFANGGVNIYSYQIKTSFRPDSDDACHVRLVCDVEE